MIEQEMHRHVVEAVLPMGEEYLRCGACSNFMPIDGVAADERCHMCGGAYVVEREEMRTDPDSFAGGYFFEVGKEMAALYGGDPRDYQRRMLDELAAQLKMEKNTMDTMENPYRRAIEAADMASVEGWMGPEPPYAGPGLLAADIDRIARAHFHAGRKEGLAEADRREAMMRGQLAQAWDEGYNAGLASRWRDLAVDFTRRLLADVHFPLMKAEEGPKAKFRENIAAVREGVTGLLSYADELKAAGETPRTPPGERRA